MKKLSLLLAGAFAAAGAVAAVEWKWDTSQHVDAVPDMASAVVASCIPMSAAAVSAEGILNLYGFSFLESNFFTLSGSPSGLCIVVK